VFGNRIAGCWRARQSLVEPVQFLPPDQGARSGIHPHGLAREEILEPRHAVHRANAKPARDADGGDVIGEKPF
jgi:hypothetical protein